VEELGEAGGIAGLPPSETGHRRPVFAVFAVFCSETSAKPNNQRIENARTSTAL
jgi:hypothetical protein